MNKKQYFLECMKLDHFKKRRWILRAMGMPKNMVENKVRFMPNNDGKQWYFFNDIDEVVIIDGADPEVPLFTLEESVTFEKEEFPNIEAKTKTAYSTAILNWILFVWPFNTPLPYMTERFNSKVIDKLIATKAKAGEITVEEYKKNFIQACGFITVFTQLAVTAATPKSITPSPEALAVRDKLLKEHAHELDDPAVLAKIDQEVSAADRRYLKGDPVEKFFLKPKAVDTVRKKLFHVQGGVPKLDDPTRMDLLPNSLNEGMTPDNMVAAVNNLRSGSYGRAKDTALGGEAAKFATRAYQNVRISSDDCGTKIGEIFLIDDDNIDKLIGLYEVGAEVPLDKTYLNKKKGKEIYIRLPNVCKEPQRNYCRRCVGDDLANSGIGIGAQMNQIGNVFMSVSLAAFHGSSLKTTRLKSKRAFRKTTRVSK